MPALPIGPQAVQLTLQGIETVAAATARIGNQAARAESVAAGAVRQVVADTGAVSKSVHASEPVVVSFQGSKVARTSVLTSVHQDSSQVFRDFLRQAIPEHPPTYEALSRAYMPLELAFSELQRSVGPQTRTALAESAAALERQLQLSAEKGHLVDAKAMQTALDQLDRVAGRVGEVATMAAKAPAAISSFQGSARNLQSYLQKANPEQLPSYENLAQVFVPVDTALKELQGVVGANTKQALNAHAAPMYEHLVASAEKGHLTAPETMQAAVHHLQQVVDDVGKGIANLVF